MRIQVVIPAHNAARFLGETLASVAAQTRPAMVVSVVDDASTDDTVAVAEVARRALAGRVDIEILRHAGPRGPAAARNTAIRHGTDPLVALLDADDLMLPDHLAILAGALDGAPEAVLAFGDTEIFSAETVRVPSLLRDSGVATLPATEIRPGFWVARAFSAHAMFGPLLRTGVFATSACVFRRQAADDAGLFDETMVYGEDTDLFLRLAVAGRFVFSRAVVSRKREHAANMSQERNRLEFCDAMVRSLAKLLRRDQDLAHGQRAQAALALEEAVRGYLYHAGWRCIRGTSCASGCTRCADLRKALAFRAATSNDTGMSGFAPPRSPFAFLPRVKAVLGPTNTGKTHLAIERLLAHSSGIIGFPLRLLARENYDRMVARVGVRNVALITGEEKIVPPEARWFSCTVEAMPLDREVEFVAVDEIQLCADPDRGHVFTERLLHARGLSETMFLGAETIRPLLSRLVPGVEIETRPRLSQLEYAGPAKLTKLPPRSAIVAFSAADVYAIAELIRRRRGGCAVVMGRLSPRTRNAQVALYQAKEVDFLVATDAIGMGLNMDVDHVAFAGLGKHDGHRPRRLTAAEVAQIAGRAGRGMRDGTFGTTGDCPSVPPEIVDAVETHSFERLEQLRWRNCDLDYAHVERLLDSLMAMPTRPGLVKGNDASDLITLASLIREPDIRRDANSPRRVRRLWEACSIPDFRKLADETHNKLCARVFAHSARDEYLPTDWLAGNMSALNRPDGDIDTLMQRLSGVRVWAYIAARADWVRDAEHWQAQAREVEDRLSDSLHERLMSRFVDRRAAHLMRKLEEGDGEALLSAVTRKGEVVVEGHPVGHVGGFRFRPDPMAEGESRKLVLRAARRALRESIPLRVGALEAAPGAAFAFTDTHEIVWESEPVARLAAGRDALSPRVVVHRHRPRRRGRRLARHPAPVA